MAFRIVSSRDSWTLLYYPRLDSGFSPLPTFLGAVFDSRPRCATRVSSPGASLPATRCRRVEATGAQWRPLMDMPAGHDIYSESVLSLNNKSKYFPCLHGVSELKAMRHFRSAVMAVVAVEAVTGSGGSDWQWLTNSSHPSIHTVLYAKFLVYLSSGASPGIPITSNPLSGSGKSKREVHGLGTNSRYDFCPREVLANALHPPA